MGARYTKPTWRSVVSPRPEVSQRIAFLLAVQRAVGNGGRSSPYEILLTTTVYPESGRSSGKVRGNPAPYLDFPIQTIKILD